VRRIVILVGVVWLALTMAACERTSHEQHSQIVHAVLSDPDPSSSTSTAALGQLLQWAGSGEDVDLGAVVLVASLDPTTTNNVPALVETLAAAPAGARGRSDPGKRRARHCISRASSWQASRRSCMVATRRFS
jgi:hypothetical protein